MVSVRALSGWPVHLSELLIAVLVGGSVGFLCLVSPLAALAGICAAFICAVACVRPVVLCYVTVAAAVLTSGMQRGAILPSLRPSEGVLLFATAMAFLIALVSARRFASQSRGVHLAYAILILGTTVVPGITYLARGVQLSVSDLLVLFAPVRYVLVFWLFAALPGNERDRQYLTLWMLLLAALVAVIGLLQGLHVPAVSSLLDRWYPSGHETRAAELGRITSLLAAWNSLGIFLMVNLLIAITLRDYYRTTLLRASLALIMMLCATGLIASGSFAGMLGLVGGVLLIVTFGGGRFRSVAVILLSVGLALLVYQPLVSQRVDYQFGGALVLPKTLEYRFFVWRDVFLPPIMQSLPWGFGLSVPANFAWSATESQYLLLLFRFGLAGLAGHLLWVGGTILWLYRVTSEQVGFARSMAISAIVILVILSVAGLTNEVFTFSGTNDYLWILLGMVCGSEGTFHEKRWNRGDSLGTA